jgi:cytidine deaminase
MKTDKYQKTKSKRRLTEPCISCRWFFSELTTVCRECIHWHRNTNDDGAAVMQEYRDILQAQDVDRSIMEAAQEGLVTHGV